MTPFKISKVWFNKKLYAGRMSRISNKLPKVVLHTLSLMSREYGWVYMWWMYNQGETMDETIKYLEMQTVHWAYDNGYLWDDSIGELVHVGQEFIDSLPHPDHKFDPETGDIVEQ